MRGSPSIPSHMIAVAKRWIIVTWKIVKDYSLWPQSGSWSKICLLYLFREKETFWSNFLVKMAKKKLFHFYLKLDTKVSHFFRESNFSVNARWGRKEIVNTFFSLFHFLSLSLSLSSLSLSLSHSLTLSYSLFLQHTHGLLFFLYRSFTLYSNQPSHTHMQKHNLTFMPLSLSLFLPHSPSFSHLLSLSLSLSLSSTFYFLLAFFKVNTSSSKWI